MTDQLIAIETTDALIASETPGIELFLRNKRPAGRAARGSILLVHGASFSSMSLFDVDVGGGSFMDVLARAGLDAWAVDVRGFGGSTRPEPMGAAPAAGTPLVRATEAVHDVAAALAHIRRERRPDRVALLGMSWGGSVAGIYAARNPGAIDALVLVAPLWLSAEPLRFDSGAPILTHRVVDVNAYRATWLAPAPQAERDRVLPPGWFERWAAATEATDREAPPGHVRAPSGPIADVREHWTANSPLYDPAAITAPSLIIRATWDVDVRRDMALDLFDRLVGARRRTYAEVAGGTHMLLMEPLRHAAYEHVLAFLPPLAQEPTRPT